MYTFIRYILLMRQGSRGSLPLTNCVLVVDGAMMYGDIAIDLTKTNLNSLFYLSLTDIPYVMDIT